MLGLGDLFLRYELLVFHIVPMILLYLFVLLLYVDDVLITGDEEEHISHVTKQLGVQFQMSNN
jgi:hypothetical protein